MASVFQQKHLVERLVRAIPYGKGSVISHHHGAPLGERYRDCASLFSTVLSWNSGVNDRDPLQSDETFVMNRSDAIDIRNLRQRDSVDGMGVDNSSCITDIID